MATADELYSTWTIRVASRARGAFALVAASGGLAALYDWGGGALLLVAGLAGAVASQVVVGVAAYRIAMHRPWPNVRPRDDDEDEWW